MKVDTVPVHSTTCSGRGQQNVALWKPHHWDKDPCQEWGGGTAMRQATTRAGTRWVQMLALSLWRRKMLAVHSLIDDGQCL